MSGDAPYLGRILFLHVLGLGLYQGFCGVHGKENALSFYVSDLPDDNLSASNEQ